MWIAVGDLLLKIVGFFTNEKNRLDASRRDELDRTADFLERIAVALQQAADAFGSTKKFPGSQIMELEMYLNYQTSYDPTVGRVFVDGQIRKNCNRHSPSRCTRTDCAAFLTSSRPPTVSSSPYQANRTKRHIRRIR